MKNVSKVKTSMHRINRRNTVEKVYYTLPCLSIQLLHVVLSPF